MHLNGQVVGRLDERRQNGELFKVSEPVAIAVVDEPIVNGSSPIGAREKLRAHFRRVDDAVEMSDLAAVRFDKRGKLGAAPDGLVNDGLENLHDFPQRFSSTTIFRFSSP